VPQGINNSGQVAGVGSDWSGVTYVSPMMWASTGERVSLGGGPPAAPGYAWGINDLGQVIGDSSGHAMLWNEGHAVDLGTFGGSQSRVESINNLGQILGSAQAADSSWHAFLYQDGTKRDLASILGMDGAYGLDLNNKGDLVGGAADGATFLTLGGKVLFQDQVLDPASGLNSVTFWKLNDRGQILGSGTIGDRYRSFLLTPSGMEAPAAPVFSEVVPEPATWLAWAGLAAVGAGIRRARAKVAS
jgi:probable HAF family extracellular repeat protein